MSTISEYQYTGLVEPGNIRLLRILPSDDVNAPIQCQLFNYALHGLIEEIHPFEALSYCWGSQEKAHSIYVDSSSLGVTFSLYTALLHLRYRFFDRILWMDAVCINQDDNQEKEQQISLMYNIYSCANCVLVWLGDAADHSDDAIEALRIAGRQRAANSVHQECAQVNTVRLLERDWFRRVWVLQEVAAARRIQILCGRSGIDGYAFCLAMDSMRKFFGTSHEMHAIWIAIQSVTFLIRGAIFRPGYPSLSKVSEGVRPFRELVDMFHNHGATISHDKVYALLGMCSDDMRQSNLSPDYGVPFHELLKRVVQFTLSEDVPIETSCDQEIAVMRSKIYVIGIIQSVEEDLTASHEQQVRVLWKDISGLSTFSAYYRAIWTLQASATPLEKGDVVCLMENATRPTVFRLYRDFSTILVIAANPPPLLPSKGVQCIWSEVLNRIRLPLRDNTLIWDWHYSPGEYSTIKTYSSWVHKTEWTPKDPETLTQRQETAGLFNCGLILFDSNAFGEANVRFREGMRIFETAIDSTGNMIALPNELPLLSLHADHQVEIDRNQLHSQDVECSTPMLTLCISALLAWVLKEGYLSGAKRIIDTRIPYSSFRDRNGRTLLCHAINGGHLNIVERLLQEHADVNAAAAQDNGRTALQAAAGGGYLDIVERLLQEHADVDAAAAQDNGRTALQAAAGGGHLNIVERLLQEHADVNAASAQSNGRTALQAAAGGGYLDIVERLLQSHANVNAAPARSDGRTALQAAAGGGYLNIVERLLQEHADVNAASAQSNGRTALQAAAGGGHLDIVERLLQAHADVNAAAAEYNGRTALQAAADGGHLDIVERLTKLGASF